MVEVTDRACLCLHVKTATWILIIVELIFSLLTLFQGIFGEARNRTWPLIGVVFAVFFLISLIFAVVALLKNTPKFLILHMVATVITIVWYIINGVQFLIQGSGEQMLVTGVVFLLIVLVLVYLLYVEYCCYKWMGG